MRNVRSLGFDSLEGRKLLTAAHHAAHHAAVHAAAVAPLALTIDGTLNLDQNPNDQSQSTDVDGDTTTSTAVAGVLGTLGKVRGYWNTERRRVRRLHGARHDPASQRQGSDRDRIQQRDHGQSPEDRDWGHLLPASPAFFLAGSGVYAKATESGTINVNSNKARTGIASLTLNTTST